MAGKKQLDTYGTATLTNYAADMTTEPEIQKKASSVNPNSLKNLRPNHRPKSPTVYMQVNVNGYEDYLYRMAKYNNKTMTKYVLSLIEDDYKKHLSEYESLKTLSQYNYERRESPNKKKKK